MIVGGTHNSTHGLLLAQKSPFTVCRELFVVPGTENGPTEVSFKCKMKELCRDIVGTSTTCVCVYVCIRGTLPYYQMLCRSQNFSRLLKVHF